MDISTLLDYDLAFTDALHASFSLLILIALSLTSVAFSLRGLAGPAGVPAIDQRASGLRLPAYIARNLGPYSPYYRSGRYQLVPPGCVIDQVNVLQRHGARFPTTNAGKRIAASVAKLQDATSLSSSLTFLRSYRYRLGADDLIALGAQESYGAGREAYERYSTLASEATIPVFVRSDSSPRVIASATNWLSGFYSQFGGQGAPTPLVISNAAGSHNTLDDKACPLAPDLSSHQTTWLATFAANAVARLNAQAPGANLETNDVLNLMQLCGFETVYSGKMSPFCGLFMKEEFEAFEYYYDLDKYYGNGYGNPLGAVQGVGYVNELLSRLTGNLRYSLSDRTQTNQTLNRNSSTFPLSGVGVYADFSHNNQIVSILAAMGLQNGTRLGESEPPKNKRRWFTSRVVPFAGRLVTERLKCASGTFVRLFIDDQLQIPTFCPGHDPLTGLCPLSSFVSSQAYARNNGDGDWEKCSARPSAAHGT